MIITKDSIPRDLPVLGDGSYGEVFLAQLDGRLVALKVPFEVCHSFCIASLSLYYGLPAGKEWTDIESGRDAHLVLCLETCND